MRTIQRQLLIYLFGGMLSATLIAGLAVYVQVRTEMNEMFDYQLKQIAGALPAQLSAGRDLPLDDNPNQEILVQIWSTKGELIFTSAPNIQLQKIEGFGFKSLSLSGKRWRVYSEADLDRIIQVAQPKAVRNDMAASMALRSLLPFLAMIPVLALFIWIVVGRSLYPLHHLARAINRRSSNALEPLPGERYPPELQPMLTALNGLLTRLDQTLATQRAFVADAAHELRTPLTALKLQLQLVERENDDRQRATGFRKLHERLNRATHLVQQLLTLARHEYRIADRSSQKIDLRQLAVRVVSDYASQAEHKSVDLGVAINDDQDSDVAMITGNEDSLRILLGNLVDNAVRYTPSHGRVDVTVNTSAADHTVLLRVRDNGPGIPVQDHERVFDRFYRRDGTGESGSGLGLFIAKTIATQHEVTIELSAADSKGGLIVTVRFPLLCTSETGSASPAPATTAKASASPLA